MIGRRCDCLGGIEGSVKRCSCIVDEVEFCVLIIWDENVERARLLDEGEALLRLGAVGHNHLWFYRDAIEAMCAAGDAPGMLRYVKALKNYTQREPLPWAELFAARGRALALALQDQGDEPTLRELEQVRMALHEAGFRHYLSAVDAALAV